MKIKVIRKDLRNSDCPSHKYFGQVIEGTPLGMGSRNYMCSVGNHWFLLDQNCVSNWEDVGEPGKIGKEIPLGEPQPCLLGGKSTITRKFSEFPNTFGEVVGPGSFQPNPLLCDQVKAKKNDIGKPQYSDLPVKTLRSVTGAFNYGQGKYGKFNYTKGMEWLRYTDACQRHLEAWKEFEDIDADSGNHHLDHAIASLMMLRESIHLKRGVDNRNPDYKQNNNNK